MRKELQKKVDRAIRLLQSIPTDKGTIELDYSTGKDSDVILELAKMAGIPYRAIYKNTTIDPAGTITHAMKNGVEVVNYPQTKDLWASDFIEERPFKRLGLLSSPSV